MSINSVFERRYAPIRSLIMAIIVRTGAPRITTSASLTPAFRSSVAASTTPFASANSRDVGFCALAAVLSLLVRRENVGQLGKRANLAEANFGFEK